MVADIKKSKTTPLTKSQELAGVFVGDYLTLAGRDTKYGLAGKLPLELGTGLQIKQKTFFKIYGDGNDTYEDIVDVNK